MWRGRSEGDKNDAQGRGGQGSSRSRSNGRPGQRGGTDGSGSSPRDPRSQTTGKKIRRIESAPTNPGQGPTANRRRPGPAGNPGQPLTPRSNGAPGDQTDIGRPPGAPPRRGADAVSRGRAPGLPPLTQPTGEIPKIPGSPDDTVVVSAPSTPDSIDAGMQSLASAASDRMPSSLPRRGAAAGAVGDATAAMPAVNAGAGSGPRPAAPVAAPQMPGTPPSASMGDNALTDPFPEASSDFGQRPSGPAPKTRSFDSQAMATAAAMGAPVDARASARPGREQSPFDMPPDAVRQQPQRRGGAPGGTSSRAAAAGAAGAGAAAGAFGDSSRAERLQDTEFKLADKRRKQKPKEPNRLILGLAMGLVVLVGVAVAYFLTRGGDDSTTESADPAAETQTEAEADVNTAAEEDPFEGAAEDAGEPAAEPEPVVDVPTLFFEQAQTAPLQQGETYSIDLVGEPEGSLLQVIVDEIPQGEPDVVLPDLILPAGRHSLYIQITNGAEISQSTPVEVYVLGDAPVQGFRANLSSVDMQTEGWAEAIRQFDEYRAAGHENLQLSPITPGYWNIFVEGFGEDSAAALTYCESFGLVVPDDCFGPYYEGTGAPAADATTETTVDAMVDESGESTTTTAAGG